jgi:signal transduction histidine kinase
MTNPAESLPEPPVNILIVDDQPANLLALEAILDSLGQNLVRATSGEEALRHLLRDDFAVILLDLQMPGLDGFETARLIRTRERSRHTPVIFLTAYQSDDFPLGEAYALGAVDYLVKPLVPQILLAKVSGFVELVRKTERLRRLERAEAERRLAQERQRWELERSQEEAERQRRRAEQLADLDRRKDEFLAMLAHELRNPLAPIRNALHVLSTPGADEASLRQAIDMMGRQVHTLVRLVDDLLDVSRITRGKIQLRKEPADLGAVLGRAVETARPLIESNRHALTVALPAEPIKLQADATRLEQVFANLLNNAAKYTERGGRISLAAERSGGEAVVRVRDNGFGIPADLLPRVFELFTQADRTLDRAEGGLGIGLTLVRSLVEMHGGTVQAFSDGPGKGSEFVVHLPVLPRSQVLIDPPPPATENGVASRVLVVDDNRDSADSLAVLVRLWGHEARTAHEGLSAVKAARAYRPEAVLLDIGLPGLDGYEVARQLRRDLGHEVLLVALTGYGQDEDRRKSREAGFDHHLVKPADPNDLRRLLARRE